MIDGIWWLVIVLVVIAVLFLIALKKQPAKQTPNQTAEQPTNNKPPKQLSKLAKLIGNHCPQYTIQIRPQHLLLAYQGKKIAMMTMDNRIEEGTRRLGDVVVINLHKQPNKSQLNQLLANINENKS